MYVKCCAIDQSTKCKDDHAGRRSSRDTAAPFLAAKSDYHRSLLIVGKYYTSSTGSRSARQIFFPCTSYVVTNQGAKIYLSDGMLPSILIENHSSSSLNIHTPRDPHLLNLNTAIQIRQYTCWDTFPLTPQHKNYLLW